MEPYESIERLRQSDDFTASDIKLLRRLTEKYSDVAELWDFLGDAIHLSSDTELLEAEPLECYLRAVECDPTYSPAYESLGHYHDLLSQFEDAERCFRLAIENGAGDSARVGVARILEQLGQTNNAELEMSLCIDQHGEELTELRREIADGFWATDDESAA